MGSSTAAFQVVILAAGKGKRMKSDLPKVLHRVCGRTLLERAVRSVDSLAPARITIVAGHGEAHVRSECDSWKDISSEIEIAIQSEQKGTGHAVQMALEALDPEIEDVLIIPGDTPLIRPETYESIMFNREAAVSVLTSVVENPSGFGRIVRGNDGSVVSIVEEKDCDENQRAINEVNSSIYLVKQSYLRESLPKLSSDNAQGEFYLTDIVALAVRDGKAVRGAVCENAKHVAGANNRYELALLEVYRRHEINKRWMEEGVTFEDFRTAYVDEGVSLGQDVFIGAGVSLKGDTVLHDRVIVDAHSCIIDSEIGRASHIKFSSHLENCQVGMRVAVGPFGRIRPGSELHDDVKIGNFVETKKAVFENGSKANHLSYIGDARVGTGANIGAGTITCNYDGEKKSLTTIGRNAFIGSNTALVAPVTVGKSAYVGAGSTITKDVPEDALGITRGKQTIIDNYARRRREGSK